MSQIDAVDVLHDEVVQVGFVAELVNDDDVGMTELGERPRFAQEALGEGRILTSFRRQDLERDDAVQLALTGLVYRPHPSLAEQLQDLQLGKSARQVRRLEGARRTP